MPVLFSDSAGHETAGRVMILSPDDARLPQFIGIANIADAEHPPEQTGIVILGGGGEYAASAQIQPTLDNSLYAYGFGVAPGAFTVSGAAFAEVCNDGEDENDQPVAGLRSLLDFFGKYNRGVYQEPLLLTLQPGVVRDGLLNSLQWRYSSPAMRMIEFTIGMVLLP